MNGEDLEGLEGIVDPFLYDWIQGDRPSSPDEPHFNISLRELDLLCAELRVNHELDIDKELKLKAFKETALHERVNEYNDNSYRAGKRDMAVSVARVVEDFGRRKLSQVQDRQLDAALAELYNREL